MTYTLTTTVDLPWTEALDRTRDATGALLLWATTGQW